MSSSESNSKKRALKFVSEGVTDLETQKAREQLEQSKFEAECKRRERKSLREQLRSNAINKQKEFNHMVKERDGFNKLNQQELDYYQAVRNHEKQKEEELERYLKEKGSEFELKRSQRTVNTNKELTKPKLRQSKSKLAGIVKKNTKQKLKLKKKSEQ